MSMMWWDPFRDVVTLRTAGDNLVPGAVLRPETSTVPDRSVERAATLPVDAYETKDELVIRALVPGATSEDVDIRVDNDMITLSAYLQSDVESEAAAGYTWYRHEIGHGRFSRSLTLLGIYDAAETKAHMDNGILTLRVPKKEEAIPKQIKVSVKPALPTGEKKK
jgi:HSP20 family protein